MVPNEPAGIVNATTVGVARVSGLSITALAQAEGRRVASGVKRSTSDERSGKNESGEE